MIRVYADFNCQDEDGRVKLDVPGSRKDLDSHRDELRDGMKVILYVPDELDVEATLVFDEIWLAIPDYATLRYDSPGME